MRLVAITVEPLPLRLLSRFNRTSLDLFKYIEVICGRARIHTALGDLSPVKFEEANWPKDEGRPKAA